MDDLVITAPAKSHLFSVVTSLLSEGWAIERAPDHARLSRNGQKILLKSAQSDLRVRLFIYKVTGSGRNRPEERRIEITSTYNKGLLRQKRFADVVLGYDPDRNLYVGIDPQRIKYGGATGNASSFFDGAGLSTTRRDRISVTPRKAVLFANGIEYHAFVSATRLAEYFFNANEIHSGAYRGNGLYSGKKSNRKNVTSLRVQADAVGGDVLVLSGPKYIRGTIGPKIDRSTIESLEGRRAGKQKEDNSGRILSSGS